MDDLIKTLHKPEFYPHPVKEIRLIETHISWVFLTGDFVYKIKKPVNFGFLDFTTLERREFFCKEEVRLNRRLSPDIYLGVIPIREREGNYSLGSGGKIIDFAVKMRELPQDTCLANLIERGKASSSLMEGIAYLMADFYNKAETNEEISKYGEPERVFINIEENFSQTIPYIGLTIDKEVYDGLKEYSFNFLEKERERFFRRISEGKIRDGHGDFHCQNIYFYKDKIYVLDCIEFNKRFRYADVASDVAFFLMDLDFRGASSLGNQFLNKYLNITGDYGLLSVLEFYKIYRAYVRGKISSFELDMPLPEEKRAEIKRRARAYFDLAYSYLRGRGSPKIIATTGLLASGKSTIARALANRLGAIVLRSDVIRKQTLGLKIDKHYYEPFGKGIYSKEITASVYDRIIELAKGILEYGFSVILDASFNKQGYREKVVKLSREKNIPYLFLHCICDEDTIRQRLLKREGERGEASDAYYGLFYKFKSSFEPPSDINTYPIDTTQPLEENINKIINQI